jgi:hypothetical protein
LDIAISRPRKAPLDGAPLAKASRALTLEQKKTAALSLLNPEDEN